MNLNNNGVNINVSAGDDIIKRNNTLRKSNKRLIIQNSMKGESESRRELLP